MGKLVFVPVKTVNTWTVQKGTDPATFQIMANCRDAQHAESLAIMARLAANGDVFSDALAWY